MWGYIYKCEVTFINVRQHLQMWGYIYKCGATFVNVGLHYKCEATFINVRLWILLRQMAPHRILPTPAGTLILSTLF